MKDLLKEARGVFNQSNLSIASPREMMNQLQLIDWGRVGGDCGQCNSVSLHNASNVSVSQWLMANPCIVVSIPALLHDYCHVCYSTSRKYLGRDDTIFFAPKEDAGASDEPYELFRVIP